MHEKVELIHKLFPPFLHGARMISQFLFRDISLFNKHMLEEMHRKVDGLGWIVHVISETRGGAAAGGAEGGAAAAPRRARSGSGGGASRAAGADAGGEADFAAEGWSALLMPQSAAGAAAAAAAAAPPPEPGDADAKPGAKPDAKPAEESGKAGAKAAGAAKADAPAGAKEEAKKEEAKKDPVEEAARLGIAGLTTDQAKIYIRDRAVWRAEVQEHRNNNRITNVILFFLCWGLYGGGRFDLLARPSCTWQLGTFGDDSRRRALMTAGTFQQVQLLLPGAQGRAARELGPARLVPRLEREGPHGGDPLDLVGQAGGGGGGGSRRVTAAQDIGASLRCRRDRPERGHGRERAEMREANRERRESQTMRDDGYERRGAECGSKKCTALLLAGYSL